MYTHRIFLTIIMTGALLLLMGCFEPEKPTETAKSVFLEKNKALSPKIEYFSILSEEMFRKTENRSITWVYSVECDVIFSLEESYVVLSTGALSDSILEDKKKPIDHLGLDYDTLYTNIDLGGMLGGHQRITTLSTWNILEKYDIPRPGLLMILHKGVKYRNTIWVTYYQKADSWVTDIMDRKIWYDIKKKRDDSVVTHWP